MSNPSRTSRLIASIASAAAFLTLAGCAGDPTAPEPLDPCTEPVTVSVSAGTTPTISWTPACSMSYMIVEQEASDYWILSATEEVGFGPGITYGTTPSRAVQNEPGLTLIAGVVYDITFFGGTLSAPIPLQNIEFTP